MNFTDQDRIGLACDMAIMLAEDIKGYRATIAELVGALAALEPHLDAIVCYASTQGEHEPNRLAFNAREVLRKARGEA